ncbi:diguanylate cyclase [Acidobacteria bacterium ACD]|nr:MAG: diguanylate cyclase [Acidobacteriota bacterium]MCE7958214.1 diguanylate cyclase [Acidobacteria bacterium ACB2]MDL1950328.1 diguanylate cyclase [Acidobacteria bacterium ACD]
MISALISSLLGLAFLGIALPPAPADAAPPLSRYVQETWQEELPQSTVHAVLQTRDGYLWLATYEGLVRFNGASFRVYDRASVPAMRSSAVWSLCEGPDGTLWAGTIGGGLLRKRGDDFLSVTSTDGLLSDLVYSLLVDRKGDLWIGTNRGVNRLRSGRLESFGRESGFGERPVRALAETADGSVWAGSDGDGLFRFRDGAWSRIGAAEGLSHPSVCALRASPDGSLWLGTYGGLQLLEAGRFRTFGSGEGLPNLRVWSILLDREGTPWVGTEGGGLSRLRGGRFETLRSGDGMPNDLVRAIAQDREGNLWVGTNGGLTRLRLGTFAAHGSRHGLTSEFVRTVLEDSAGRVWAGTDGGGLFRLGGERWAQVPLPGGPGSELIRALAEGRDGALWVGTAGAGLVRLADGETTLYAAAQGFRSGYVRSLLVRSDGTVWAGTNDGIYAVRGGRVEPVGTDPRLRRPIVALLEGRDGRVWAGTSTGGVVALEGTGLRVWGREQGLPAEGIFSLLEDADGSIWVGTQLGLCRIRGSEVERFGHEAGVPEDAVFSILDDGDGGLWLSGNRGVLRLSRAALEGVAEGSLSRVPVRLFGKADGMPSRQCNGSSQPAGFRGRDGRLWYATAGGLAVVDPRRIARNLVAPRVVVESVLVDGEPRAAAGTLDLPPGTRRVEIAFAALSFSAPDRVSCRYRLEGFDQAWRDASGSRRAEYTSLSPGTYLLVVAAANEDGVWNETGTSLTLRQRARLHQSRWFLGVAAGLLLAGTFAAHRIRVRSLTARQELLERVVEEKTRALVEEVRRTEEANSRLSETNLTLERIALVDPLTGLANRRRFEEALDGEWRRERRAGEPLALVLFDVDHFKAFNDQLGHPEGDRCLRQVAEALATGVRRGGDLVCRWGGEEFAVLLPGTALAEAADVARTLLSRVEELGIPHTSPPSPAPFVSLSAGVAAMVPTEGLLAESLVTAADAALYEAKRRGRRRVVVAGWDL